MYIEQYGLILLIRSIDTNIILISLLFCNIFQKSNRNKIYNLGTELNVFYKIYLFLYSMYLRQ